ncbi:hypothetical protein AX16_004304 [Volvariella volvacea WC 439]|nr:hypothetical protein AX16_004304 [Volvariella volvacea WC 439]
MSYGYSGGWAAAAPPPPVPGADPQLWQWFCNVDHDRSGAITAVELQQALVNGDWSRFDLDTVKLLMTIFDQDRSGTIGFNEFVGLWKYIKDWQGIFRHFDRDGSGSIDRSELQTALSQLGFNLPPHIIELVQRKYGLSDGSRQRPDAPSGINFDRFVRACVVIKQLVETFQRLDEGGTGSVTLTYESFMTTNLSLP